MLGCATYQKLLPAHLDGFLLEEQRRAVELHLWECPDCAGEFRQLGRWSEALQQAPSPDLPSAVLFRVRQQISLERDCRQRPHWAWSWAKRMEPLVLPMASGLACALLFFGTLVPLFATRPEVHSKDVPLALKTSPRFLGSTHQELRTEGQNLVMVLLVDARGRVADYDIVAGDPSPRDLRNLRNALLFTRFDPGTLFGRPRPDRVIFSFQSLDVKG